MVKIKNHPGFTLIEILITVSIITLLMGLLIGPRLVSYWKRAKIGATKIALKQVQSALTFYHNDIGSFPSTREGLEVLIENPSSEKGRWGGPYLGGEKEIKDGWNNDFEYNSPPVQFKKYRYYELMSYGEGGEAGGEDASEDLVVGY